MSSLGILLLALSGISFLAFLIPFVRQFQARNQGLARQRLKRLGARMGDQNTAPGELSILRQSSERLTRSSASSAHRFALRTWERVELLLYRANSKAGAGRLVLLSASLGGLFLTVSLQIFFNWGAALALGLVGLSIPSLVFKIRADRRLKAFETSFPEALALIGRSLRGGHALQGSLRVVADEMRGPVASEFSLVADEISLGGDMMSVLEGLSHRVALPDVDLFVGGVLLQRDYGGNLAEVVDKLATTIRERFKFQSKVLAITSTSRNSALMLLLIPFAFVGLMYFANRDFIRPLWETSEGNSLSMVASILALSGYLLARRVARVRA